MASQAAANALTNLARAAVGIGFAGSALSASMYDGACSSPPRATRNAVTRRLGERGDHCPPARPPTRRFERDPRDAPPATSRRAIPPDPADLRPPPTAGTDAVMFDRFRGVLPKAIGEGTHFLIPFVQRPTVYDIRTFPEYHLRDGH